MAMFKKTPAKTATAKKNDKTTVVVKGDEFAEKLEKFAVLQSKIKNLESELQMAQSFVKESAIEEFAKLITSKKSNPGSFIVKSESGAEVMVVPTKRYIKIGETSAENLKETYGEDIVTENTKYGFNTEILMRNMDVIEKILMGSDEITADDKDALIEGVTTFAVEKDTLDKVYILASEAKVDVSEVIEDIQPVVQLKNPKASPTKK